MAKLTYKIGSFHGGLNNNADPRDVKDDQSPDLSNVNIDRLGMLRLGPGLTSTNDSNTLQVLPNRGLFSMSSDKQLDGGDANETLLVAYDAANNNFDIKDSEGWDTGGSVSPQISLTTTHPVYYVADGNLRIADGSFTNDSKWFGYISDEKFDGLNGDSAAIGWYASNSKIDSPTTGRCFISNPYKGSDGNTVNSSEGEYDGTVADGSSTGTDVALIESLNLRVGVQMNELLADAASEISSGVATGVSKVSLSDSTTYYPILGNSEGENNYYADSAANAKVAYWYLGSLSFNINETQSLLIPFIILTNEVGSVDEYAKLKQIRIKLGNSDMSNYVEWRFGVKKILPDKLNYLVLSMSNLRTVGGSGSIDDTFTNIQFEVHQLSSESGNASPTFHFSGPALIPAGNVSSFQPGLYNFHYTWLYDDSKQESLPFKLTSVGTKGFNEVHIVGAPMLFNFDVYMSAWNADPSYTLNKRISGARIYWTVEENDNYFLIGELDFINKGFKWIPEADKIAYDFANSSHTTSAPLNKAAVIKGISPTAANTIDTFQSINGFSTNVSSVISKYKTAVLHGRRIYVGNIKQNTNGVDKTFPDRMLKSQINKFDTFPEGMGLVDVAIRDGESIVKLEAFADRILQFKQKTLYIINVSDNVEFLEDTYIGKGVSFDYHVVKTDYGIAWFNEMGVFFYDGKNVSNLLEKQNLRLIREADWQNFIKTANSKYQNSSNTNNNDTDFSECHIAYIPKKRKLWISNGGWSVFEYDFVYQSWVFNKDALPYDTNRTNWVLDGNLDVLFVNNTTTVRAVATTNPQGSSDFKYITKDIDFGEPGVRKKIYKVYITYKTGATTNTQVKYDINGGTTFDKTFQNGTNFSSNNLANAGSGAWTQATLKPSTSSEANNIYSFALKITNDGSGSATPSTFMINDITIIYRIKNPR